MAGLRHAWLVLLVAGCATTTTKPAPDAWLLKPEWTSATKFGNTTLRGRTGKTYPIFGAHMANLRTVLLAIREQSGMDPQLSLVADDSPNAFASSSDGHAVIGLTLSMLEAIGPDPDALATTIGHELAHLRLNHGSKRKQRTESARGVGELVGVLLGVAGVPMGGSIASVGVGVVTTAYSREDEREADILGLKWAMAAGYSACGSARTMRILKAAERSASLPFLSSHPGHDERIERAQEADLAAGGKGC